MLPHERYIHFLLVLCFVKNSLYSGLIPNISVCISFDINDLPYIFNENIIIVYYDAQVPTVSYFIVTILI